MQKLVSFLIVLLILSSCHPDAPIVVVPTFIDTITHNSPIDTIINYPLPVDVLPIHPKDTTIIIPIAVPKDTILTPPPPPPPLPPIVIIPKDTLKNFVIKFDNVNNVSVTDLIEVLFNYTKDCRKINIEKVDLGYRTGQAFYILANDSIVNIKYTTETSLENGIYTYLDMLGIRWYGAGESWLYKPKVLNTVNMVGEWLEPSFRNRIFAGTGGLETPIEVDPTYSYRNNWYTWKRRNRFNSDFNCPGHVGGEFYLENRAVLDSNPDWFASYNNYQGKQYGRLKIDSSKAVDVFKGWAKKQYSPNNVFNIIGTDSEDGKGGYDDPLPADGFDGISKWNHADKWWWLTNETAKQFDENDDKIKVGALSYGDGPYNALVPKFKLRKNVYPMVTPYAFQTAYLPKQMIKTWAASITGKMAIYDYWNITQWSLGLPQLDIYNIPDKLKFWQANKIDGMNIETTDAGGPMGHAWWLAGQLEFDLSKNIDILFNKYVKDCFGNGSEPMKRMYTRWSLNYQYNQEVNFSLKDLNDASNLVDVNSDEWKRLIDVKSYVHFMKLMAQRNSTQTNNDSLYQYIYGINSRMQVQTAAFTGQSYLGPAPKAITNHQFTDSEIEIQFQKDFKELPLEYEVSSFKFDYDKVVYTDSIPIDSWKFGIFSGGYFKAPFTGKVSIDIGTQGQTTAKILSEDSIFLNEVLDFKTNYSFEERINGMLWHEKNYIFDVEKGKIYTVGGKYGFNRVRIRTDSINMFFVSSPNDFDNAQYPDRYFYVPKGTKKIAYLDPETQPINGRGYLVAPNGELMIREKTTAANVYTVPVREGQDGKIWQAAFGSTGWAFISLPNISSLQKFKYNEN